MYREWREWFAVLDINEDERRWCMANITLRWWIDFNVPQIIQFEVSFVISQRKRVLSAFSLTDISPPAINLKASNRLRYLDALFRMGFKVKDFFWKLEKTFREVADDALETREDLRFASKKKTSQSCTELNLNFLKLPEKNHVSNNT